MFFGCNFLMKWRGEMRNEKEDDVPCYIVMDRKSYTHLWIVCYFLCLFLKKILAFSCLNLFTSEICFGVFCFIAIPLTFCSIFSSSMVRNLCGIFTVTPTVKFQVYYYYYLNCKRIVPFEYLVSPLSSFSFH